ncbi:hypothetical protein ACN20G_12885 [Streptomyces sp. BI20]|uniref:hypothetical protein n=1 Tax=Streptomyces sp. BI20 TaxID=3403460 RepID=UPI003C70A953
MPIDPYAALNAMIRAEAARYTPPTAAERAAPTPGPLDGLDPAGARRRRAERALRAGASAEEAVPVAGAAARTA